MYTLTSYYYTILLLMIIHHAFTYDYLSCPLSISTNIHSVGGLQSCQCNY